MPPKEVGPDKEYQAAAKKLSALQASHVLVQDGHPALYAYSQTYAWAGRQYTRRALLAGVRATEFYESIWPHERPSPAQEADRLKLIEYTHTQLSPIFGFYEDTARASKALWDAVGASAALAEGELNGVREQVWAVTDKAAIARIAQAMASQPIYIADGPPVATPTAMNYAAELTVGKSIPGFEVSTWQGIGAPKNNAR